jgi:hypothetical protein
MWASCNLGASSPEELGETYKWGETDEHKNGEKEYTENPYLGEYSYSYDRDAVTVSMKDNPYTKYLHYRMPTAELWQELIDNTTQEVYTNSEGRNICKYTSNINGNYILLPLLMEVNGNDLIYYKTSTPSSNNNFGSVIRIWNDTGGTYIISYGPDAQSYQNNYVRGVCSYPPKTDIIQYGNRISSDSTFVLTSAHNIEITCPEDFTVYFSNTPDFTPDPSDENVVKYYTAQKHGDNYDIQISCQELSFGQSEHDYLYMSFVCNQSTQLTPSLWNMVSCSDQSVSIKSSEEISLKTSSKSNIYRLRYIDWVGYDFSIQWKSYGLLSLFIADAYDIMLSGADPHVMWSKTIEPDDKIIITAAQLEGWYSRVDADGFLYVRVSPSLTGRLTITSAKPLENN